MLKIAIIDIAASYAADAPLKGPLGGTQAAVCYLAAALAARGHAITLINQNREPTNVLGVQNMPPEKLDEQGACDSFDVLVFNGRWTEKMVRVLSKKTRAPFIGWMHEAAFNDPWCLPLPFFHSIVFVSAWQHRLNAPLLPKDTRGVVHKNAVAPFFHGMFPHGQSISAHKTAPPHIAYCGSSKRGLFYLPALLPALYAARPDLRFSIFSECVVGTSETENEGLRASLAALPGVVWVGGLPQHELAQQLAHASYFISPNHYPETFCIALAEAMAAGCVPIITARAALPDTAAGFATLVPVENADSPDYLVDGLDLGAFLNATLNTIAAHEALAADDKEKKLRMQVDFTNAHYCWDTRAAEWEAWLQNL